MLERAMLLRQANADLEGLGALEAQYRGLVWEVETARAEQNRANKKIASAPPEERPAAIALAKEMSGRLQELEDKLRQVKRELDNHLRAIPNLVYPQAPEGKGDESNKVLREVGIRPEFDFEPQDHLQIGEGLGIIDVERAAKVSGARFGILRGDAALLELALVRFAFDRLASEGFTPVIPPVLVRQEAMYGTGFFPTDEAQVYKTASDDLYLAGTSEVALASMHSGETFAETDLPVRYAGFSTCFRREAGTYGKDTRGIIRVHQFDKVEMFSFCSADLSEDEHLKLLSLEEDLFTALEIPFRVIEICAGDLADPNYRKFDLEAWLPGSSRWMEITSCSNDIDYQARRLGIRVKSAGGNPLVHTLNGTAVAVQRCMVALLENHQLADGSVRIPAALAPYTGFELIQR